MFDPSDFRCKRLTKDAIREKAEEFREKCWPQKTVPVDMEEIIEKCLGLHIIPEHGIGALTQIDAYLRCDLSGIVVDYNQYMDERNRYANRLRFTFAHEIGHLVLHKDIYNRFSFSTTEEYIEFINSFPAEQYFYFEYQAKEFAGRLLVPRKMLVDEIGKIYEYKIASNTALLRLLKINPEMLLDGITPEICRPFGVSEKVIRIRIEREGLWPPIII
jgi:hypothetical protein